MQPPKLPKVLFQNHNSWWKADARWTCGLVLPVENLSAASQSLNSTLPQGIQIWLIQVTFHQLHVYYFDRFWSCSMFILQGTSPCVLQTSVTSSDARLRWNIVRILCSSIQPFALCVCGENMVLSRMGTWVNLAMCFREQYVWRSLHTGWFLATLVALHFTPVSKWVSKWVVVSD